MFSERWLSKVERLRWRRTCSFFLEGRVDTLSGQPERYRCSAVHYVRPTDIANNQCPCRQRSEEKAMISYFFDVQILTEKQNEGARDRQADSKKKDTQLKLNRDSA